ncbi:Ger(x)C family spore germination protein [Paenibacillus methanolicus]|uniref:Spore germination protein KC n=1 Tax=Paenibacillus methanolicus TaxID=582686 RepID=A0A5S5BY85_9BACL|nr:Ger(x)C family spore germination protein [Paenibacillus methanolicus]TYP71909.1 spore germination protein KC [Paenibacillus methanolicus]
MFAWRRYSTIFRYGWIILPSLLLSGCWDRIEVNDVAVITAAGIDASDDNLVELSVQIFAPKEQGNQQVAGQAGNGASGSSAIVQSAKGKTVPEAFFRLQGQMTRQMFWGQCNVFIMSETVAKEGIRGNLDYLLRQIYVRGNSHLFISHGKAKSMLQQSASMERNSAELLNKLSENGNILKMAIGRINNRMISDVRDSTVPWIRTLPMSKGKLVQSAVGAAIFKKDKMVGHIDEKQTEGLLWMKNEMKEALLNVKLPESDGLITVRLYKMKTNLIPRIKGNEWSMTIKGFAEDDIVMNATNLQMGNPVYVKELEKEVEQQLIRTLDRLLQQVQHKMNADVLDFGETFHRKYPKQWQKAKDRWHDIYPTVKVDYDLKVVVRRPGKLISPAGLIEQEVK